MAQKIELAVGLKSSENVSIKCSKKEEGLL